MATNQLAQIGVSVFNGVAAGNPNGVLGQIGISVLFDSKSVCRKVNVINGSFKDSEGNPLTGGRIVAVLSSDGQSCDNSQVCGGLRVSAILDNNGNVPAGIMFLWPQSCLTPTTTTYVFYVYSASGQLMWNNRVTVNNNSATFDLNAVVPQGL